MPLYAARHTCIELCVCQFKALITSTGLQGGDLFSALHSSPGAGGAAHPLSWWRRGRSVALDVARGLHFLHSEHVVGMAGWSRFMHSTLYM